LNIRRMTVTIIALAILLYPIPSLTSANPIPTPTIMMTDEYINALIYQKDGSCWAYVYCRYPFKNVGYSTVTMKFPVPPNSEDISVFVDNLPVYWSWSEEKYSTEIGEYGMITWKIDNPPEEFEVKVVYRHKLVDAAGEYVFLYALGTGRYMEYYAKQVTAHIRMAVTGVAESYAVRLGSETIDSGRADETPLTLRYDLQSSMFRPFTEDFVFSFNASIISSDLILSTDKHVYVEGDIVEFWLRNVGEESVMLRNSAPWMIVSVKHGVSVVYTPVALQVMREVAPGETVSWTWDQRNNAGDQVEPGLYAVILEAGERHLVTPFIIRKAVEFPGSLNLTLRLYPEKAAVNIDALIESRPGEIEAFKNLTANAAILPKGDKVTGAFYIDGMIDPGRIEEFPLNSLSLHIRYEKPSGEGNVSIDFKPGENMPLEKAFVEFTASQEENSSLIDLNLNASIVFSKEYLKDETANMLEMYIAALSTQAGTEMAKQKVEEATDGSVKLENLALIFSRETYTLNCTAAVKIDASALTMLPSAVPGVPEEIGSLQPNVRIEPVNLTSLGLNAEYDGETGVFSGELMMVAEGNVSAMVEKAGEALIDEFAKRSAAASMLSGWLKDFRIGIHGRLDFALTYPSNELHVSGISLQYREDPSLTSAKIMEAFSGMSALPRNIAVIVEAGSTEYEEVTLKLPTGEQVKRICILGNASALSNVTYEVGGNPWRIADYKTYEEKLTIGGHEYQAVIATNSTLKEVKAETGKITIKVEGLSGFTGGLNLLVPKTAFGGADPESIEVLVDGEPAGWILTEKDGNYSILVTYPQYRNTVEVKWTVPSVFPTMAVSLVAGVVAVAVAAAIIIVKKRSA